MAVEIADVRLHGRSSASTLCHGRGPNLKPPFWRAWGVRFWPTFCLRDRRISKALNSDGNDSTRFDLDPKFVDALHDFWLAAFSQSSISSRTCPCEKWTYKSAILNKV